MTEIDAMIAALKAAWDTLPWRDFDSSEITDEEWYILAVAALRAKKDD